MDKELFIFLRVLFSFFFSLVVSFIINKLLIKNEKKRKLGQKINDYLQENHKVKANTPSLGGIGILFGILLTTFCNYKYFSLKVFLLLSYVFLIFSIGLIDDFFKIVKKDYHGLSPLIRFLYEIFISLIFVFILVDVMNYREGFYISKNNYMFLGTFFIFFITILLTGIINSVNLTDGLDGMAGFLYLAASIPFILTSLLEKEYGITFILISSFGSTLGFLMLNLYPAKIFMGDSGSLLLGALLGGTAIILKKEVLLLIASSIFIFETFTVILQVFSFKAFKKRIFLMTPFHHHLEMKGLKEYQVVMIMMVISLVLSLFGLLFEVII